MSEIKERREEWLLRVIDQRADWFAEWISNYSKKYHHINRGVTLSVYADRSIQIGLKSYFLDDDLPGLKQNFYISSKLIMASQREVNSGLDVFSTYQPFLYGLLCDSPEIYDWLAHVEIKTKDYVKGWGFRLYQCQLVLRQDDAALRETIAIVAKKGGNRDKEQAVAGGDFFSLLLKRDKAALQVLIENTAKMKVDEYDLIGQFLSGYAVILAKLCWIHGIEVEINNPLVPKALLPVKPMNIYDVKYDFLRPDWTPPELGVLEKIARWFK